MFNSRKPSTFLQKNYRRIVITTLALMCAACVSPSQPPSFYLLQPLAEQNTTKLKASHSLLLVDIKAIEIAEYLNRPQLVQSHGDFQLHRSQQHRWAEPLDDAIERVTLENISRLSHAPTISQPLFSLANQAHWQLKAKVLSLNHNAGKAQLRVHWQWQARPSKKPLAAQINVLEVPSEAGPQAQAKAYSQLLLQWSELLVAQIKAYNTGNGE